MRRFRMSSVQWAAALAIAIAATPTRAHADITLYDKDGWKFHTSGLVASHFQIMTGDDDPSTMNGVLVGGQILPAGAQDSRDHNIFLSRVRSGFIGTQIGFGADRKISDSVHIESQLAVNLYDISSNRGQTLPKEVDFREAWAAVVTPYGSFKFGRMLSIFGSAGTEVVLLAYRDAVGHPCYAAQSTIACASVGAGPIYPGFDAQMRYVSPRVSGLEFQFAVSDPVVAPRFQMSPIPRFDADLNYEQSLGPGAKLRLYGQGVIDMPQRVEDGAIRTAKAWGAMAAGVLEAAGFSVGAGGWTGDGMGTRVILEAPDSTNAVAYDSTGELRQFRGFFGNVAYDYHGSALAAGAGETLVRPTTKDLDPAGGVSVVKQQFEWHIVATQKFDALTLTAEYTNWKSQWHFGEKQNLTFMGVGANYAW